MSYHRWNGRKLKWIYIYIYWKEFILKDYRPGQPVICFQVNNGFQQTRAKSVRFCGKRVAQIWVCYSSYSDYTNKGISQGLPVCFSLISFLDSYAWVYYKQNHKPNESLHPYVCKRFKAEKTKRMKVGIEAQE